MKEEEVARGRIQELEWGGAVRLYVAREARETFLAPYSKLAKRWGANFSLLFFSKNDNSTSTYDTWHLRNRFWEGAVPSEPQQRGGTSTFVGAAPLSLHGLNVWPPDIRILLFSYLHTYLEYLLWIIKWRGFYRRTGEMTHTHTHTNDVWPRKLFIQEFRKQHKKGNIKNIWLHGYMKWRWDAVSAPHSCIQAWGSLINFLIMYWGRIFRCLFLGRIFSDPH